jgi:hypothetical protein
MRLAYMTSCLTIHITHIIGIRAKLRWRLLTILNNNIRPPITIQTGRNKQTFDTYAFTFDIVPLVLEETCFVGHTFEYKWKTKQKAHNKKHKAEVSKRNK